MMITNSVATIYNKYIDPVTRSEKYQRTVIGNVFWENQKATNVIKSGLLAADQASIYVPFANGMNHLDPVEWQVLTSKTGKWTLQVEDIIVKGSVTDDITTSFTLSDLEDKNNDVLRITSIDTQDYGSPALQHWQIGAK